MKRALVILAALSLSEALWAHVSGHGPRITERGPGGGRLSAVVPATEIDRGEKATVTGVGELLDDKGQLSVRLLSANGRPLADKEGARDVKLIVQKSPKPHVESIRFEKFPWILPAEATRGASVVELILQPVGSHPKEVVAFPIAPAQP